MKMTHPPTIRKPSEGRRIGIVGDVYRFLATGEETDGKYATFEAIVPPGSGPPPHIHSREEESFLVLEGQMTFQLGEDRFVAEAGTFLNMPVGSLHCFKNESDKTARLLISVAPADWSRCSSRSASHLMTTRTWHRRRHMQTSKNCSKSPLDTESKSRCRMSNLDVPSDKRCWNYAAKSGNSPK